MSGIESITLSTPRESVTLTGDALKRFDRIGGELVTGSRPDAHVRVPRDGDFETAGDDFLPDGQLDEIATALRDALTIAQDPGIALRWRRKGGEKAGKATFGQCVKLSGHAKHFAGCDYLIWLAADHVRQAEFSARELEALIYHELRHVHVEYDEKTGDPIYKVVGHDAELFLDEYRRYGPWRLDLQRVESTMRQLPLVTAD